MQHALARSYGFESWSALKEHVELERVSAAELADEFLRPACVSYGDDDWPASGAAPTSACAPPTSRGRTYSRPAWPASSSSFGRSCSRTRARPLARAGRSGGAAALPLLRQGPERSRRREFARNSAPPARSRRRCERRVRAGRSLPLHCPHRRDRPRRARTAASPARSGARGAPARTWSERRGRAGALQ